MPRTRTVHAQTLHYFARVHRGAPAGPVGGPASWVAADHADPTAWTHTLTAAERADLEATLARPEVADRPLEALVRTPLGALDAHVAGWRHTLTHGRGFLRLRGVPVGDWGEARTGRFFWLLGLALGVPGAQNGQEDLLGHVRDLREAVGHRVRQYRTAEGICYHCDAADAVGLLCLQPARSGGLSRIASSVAIFDRIVTTEPDLAAALFEPLHLDVRMDGGVDALRVVPAAWDGQKLRTFYHSEYFRTAPEHPGIPPLSPRQVALLDRFDALAASPEMHLEMDLAPGDIQLLSNHTIVHGRTAFADDPDPARRRHLLRLWLSLEPPPGPADQLRRLRSLAPLAWSLLARKRAVKARGAGPS